MKESGLYEVFRNTTLPTPVAGTSGSNRGGAAGRSGPVRYSTATMIRNGGMMLATPRKTDADRGGRGDVLSQLQGHHSRHAEMPTPRASDMKAGGHGDTGRMGTVRHHLEQAIALETLPTPTRRDSRMDGWSPAYDRRKSPTMDAVMDGAMLSLIPTATGNLTAPAMQKWAGARALAALLRSHGLTGTAALPITYGWMMGFPPWVADTRFALGGPRGTAAAGLIVEAFGDAVVPQIPEAIGRAILRTELALNSVYSAYALSISDVEPDLSEAPPDRDDDGRGDAP